ncbi:hypothetical protein [Catenuloplanes atrovinosus]|uniref:Uncharacterized protein n=1 Tax=Catenuloplanes atrovinosus TaxID=137266 RepID=A0AAE3YN67_9ACTN|nr:hypothetical protein [Catenuloplanes atrovinosus]MDR7275268.1 hypothetical protein [Catenuloplanes atrovinosus]
MVTKALRTHDPVADDDSTPSAPARPVTLPPLPGGDVPALGIQRA